MNTQTNEVTRFYGTSKQIKAGNLFTIRTARLKGGKQLDLAGAQNAFMQVPTLVELKADPELQADSLELQDNEQRKNFAHLLKVIDLSRRKNANVKISGAIGDIRLQFLNDGRLILQR